MTIAQQLRQEGKETGRKEGRKESLCELLLDQLRQKFGSVGESYVARLEAADDATLKRYGRRILTAGSIEEVFEE